MSGPIRVLIADDHPVVRDGLRAMFTDEPGFEVAGEAATGAEAVTMAVALAPDLILMDLRMPTMDGVAAIRSLRQHGVPSHILVLTTYDGDADVLAAIAAGATGYLLKDAPRTDLLQAARTAARGQSVLSPTVATALVGQLRDAAPARDPLSQREMDVLALIANGSSNRDVARVLFISEATVKTHLQHLYTKLGVNDRAAAVAAAYDAGVLTPQPRGRRPSP